MVGKTLSHYHIEAELGRGGMGIVYRATDTKLDRTVAIKVLPSAALASEDDRARFYREAKAAAQLHHPHIASVFEIDEAVPSDAPHGTEPSPFIAMEYIAGDSLESHIKERPLKLDEAVRLARQIASGLEAAHEKNIVHRDIKSANVMLTEKGAAKILDFGLAKTAQSTKLTRMGSTMGTVAYMSPEQARGEEVDWRTDLWSLGAVLHEMITGRHPFPGDYEQAVVYGILNQDPEPLTDLRSSVPLELERIVAKCLNKDIKRRYQHADDLIADLEGIDVSNLSKTGSRINPVVAVSPDRAPTRSLPLKPLVGGMVLGGLIVAGVLLTLFSDGTGSRVPHILSMNRITIEPVVEMWPSIHPNGNQIVYAAGKINDMKLYYRLIEGGPPNRLIEGLEGAQRWPSYSPDGNQVLFTSGPSIYTVESLGGTPRPVALADEGEVYLTPAWSPTGSEIVFASNRDSVFVRDLASNQRLLSVSMSQPHSPSWSPDGAMIALVSVNSTEARTGTNVAPTSIWLLRVSDGERYQVTSTRFMDLSPVWSPDGKYLYYISNQGGGLDIYRQRIPAFGKPATTPDRLTTGLTLHSIDLSNDGRRLIGGVLHYSQNIWKAPLHTGGVFSMRNAVPVTNGDQIIEGIALSPDGTRMAYDSDARGITHLFVMSLPEGNPFQVTSGDAPDFVYDWSPFGDELSFHTFINGSRDVYTVSVSDLSETLISDAPEHDRYPVWFGDPNTVGFHRGTSGGAEFVVTHRQKDGAWSVPEMLVPQLEYGADWSERTHRLLYTNGKTLYTIDPETGDARVVEGTQEMEADDGTWSTDGETIYFRSTDDKGGGYWSVPASGGTPRQIISLDGRTVGIGVARVDRDNLYVTLTEVDSDIWSMELSE